MFYNLPPCSICKETQRPCITAALQPAVVHLASPMSHKHANTTAIYMPLLTASILFLFLGCSYNDFSTFILQHLVFRVLTALCLDVNSNAVSFLQYLRCNLQTHVLVCFVLSLIPIAGLIYSACRMCDLIEDVHRPNFTYLLSLI